MMLIPLRHSCLHTTGKFLATLCLCIAASAPAFAQCHGNNGTYEVMEDFDAETAMPAPHSPSLMIYNIYRVVGPGSASEFTGDGFLKNWDVYVANGVLARTA